MSVLAMTALLKELMMQRYTMPFPGHQAGWAVVMIAVCMDTWYLKKKKKKIFNFTLLNRIQLQVAFPKFMFLIVSCLDQYPGSKMRKLL